MPKTIIKRKRGRPSLNKSLDPAVVLNEALAVFAEKGFEGTQQKDIADRLGVSNPLLSYHFKNKDEIWRKSILALAQVLRERFESVRSMLKDLKGIPLLKAYNRQMIYFFTEHPNFSKVLLQELNKDTWRAEFLSAQVLSILLQFGGETMEGAIGRTKEFSKIPPSVFIPMMISIAAAPVMMNHYIQKEYKLDSRSKDYVEKHSDIVNSLIFEQFENQ